jgi:hypothetical protein
MTAIWAALSASPLFRKIVVVLGLVLAVLLALAGVRRSAEKAGRLVEREAHRAEAIKAERRVREVERQMDAVPRPTVDDAAKRLSDGTF